MIANELGYGKGFKGTILYNIEGYEHAQNPDKCLWHASRNLPTNDPEANWAIMRANADLSARCEKPVYHFSIDFHESENHQLDQERATHAATKILERMELADHQAMIFFHTDTDHQHLHVVVNRVDETGRANDPWKSITRLERATAEVAHEMDFMVVPGKHNRLGQDHDYDPQPSRGENMRAEREHDESLARWNKTDTRLIRETLEPHFEEADSWEGLSGRLAESGLELRAKGQGLIITDGTHYAKLSDMGKQIRLSALEQAYAQTWNDFAQDAATTRRTAHLVHAYRDVERFDGIYDSARTAGETLRNRSRTARRDAWLQAKSQDVVAYHQAEMKILVKRTYRSPARAQLKIQKFILSLWADSKKQKKPKKGSILDIGKTSFASLLKLRTVQTLNKQKFLKEQERRIYQRTLKLIAARNRMEQLRIRAAISKSRASHAQIDYQRIKDMLGSRQMRQSMRQNLHSELDTALAAITPRDIERSAFHKNQQKAMSALVSEPINRHQEGRQQSIRHPGLVSDPPVISEIDITPEPRPMHDQENAKRGKWAKDQRRIQKSRDIAPKQDHDLEHEIDADLDD